MQHLIKRQTGMRAGEGLLKDKRTLAERPADARKAPGMAEPDEFVAEEEPLELTELAPDQDDDIEQLVEVLADVDATDAIVQQAMAARGAVPAGGQGKTCLVVDDSRVVRKLAGKIAAELGYSVIEAEDGREALLRCEKAMPDLVVTDWQMPVMSGPEFVRALRALPTPKRPTVVFCTSKGEAKDIHTGIGAGADDYIVKPFTEEALKAKLVKVMAG